MIRKQVKERREQVGVFISVKSQPFLQTLEHNYRIRSLLRARFSTIPKRSASVAMYRAVFIRL